MIYDGHTLRFAGGRAHGGDLEQARRQASSLADELSKATGEPVAVRPVLALPGWFVERTGRGDDVIVVSAKALKCLMREKPCWIRQPSNASSTNSTSAAATWSSKARAAEMGHTTPGN